MFKKLFGGQKSAYFLELDESKNQQPEQAKEEAKAQEKAPAKPVEEKKAEPAKATAPEQPKAETTKAKATKKTSVKENSKAAPAPKETKPAVADPEEIIRAAVFKNSSNGKVDSAAVSFASNGSITPTMSRRRPGPSLNMYKNMARQVKSAKK
jgi:hypothetical protein